MKLTKSILILLTLFVMFSCNNNSTEPLVCGEGTTELNGECVIDCGEGLTNVDGICYYQGDIDVLQNIIDVNDSLSGEPLEIGSQLWVDGRLDVLDLAYNQLTTLPESIGNLNSLSKLKLGGFYEG